MSLTKLPQGRNNLIIIGQGESSDIPAGDGKHGDLFLQCTYFFLVSIGGGVPIAAGECLRCMVTDSFSELTQI